ncbi:flavin monoamine oxidase family protein [Lichenicoccus sp.]|uniref:flavin monoamine oxidase family protein n=1 Tax=Lichenicoccus sp. TaxID=2781899 RepID=UPI003D0C95C0
MTKAGRSGPDYDAVIIGAGAAGLAASAVLHAAGCRSLLLEADCRIGGRAHTLHPAILGGARFDAGATWLHQTDRNPLVCLARARGIALRPAFRGGRRLLVEGRRATGAEAAAYDASRAAWERLVTARADGPDCSLAEAGTARADDPWTASIENWDGAIIAAADATDLGLHDWRRNLLDDNNLSPPDGVGTLLATLLGPLVGPARLNAGVERIAWHDGEPCVVQTGGGTVTARAVIVTVSTGVLRAHRIAFEPALPQTTAEALDGLPMGLLSKLAIPVPDPVPGLDDETLIERRVPRRGAPGMLVSVRPHGHCYASGFFGGRHAWSRAGQPDAALDEARTILCEAEPGAVTGAGGYVTAWGTDPLFRGAYSYCRPGRAASREMLGRPLGGGRLLFAGEACRTDGLAGTVGGALFDGERAAQAVLRCIMKLDSVPSLASAAEPRVHG